MTHPTAGVGVDGAGNPVVDPTQNVLDLVQAAIQRQDDLRLAESRHVREVAALRAEYTAELRLAETARIDAIRAVDVAAVQRATEVASQQALTLAAQVAASAETLRNQVSAAASASQAALSAALEPITKDIADLRRAQYEQAGGKAQVVEKQAAGSQAGQWVAIAVAVLSLLITIGVLLTRK